MNPSGNAFFAILGMIAVTFLSAPARASGTASEYPYGAYPVRTKPGFHAVERLGITLGGDEISKITYPDGAIREINAGSLKQIGLGALYQWDSMPVAAALTINYQYTSDYNENDNAAFRRVPLEALLHFNAFDRFRIGAGIRYVYSARATSNINGVSERIDFEDTRGRVLEIGYQFLPYAWLSLRKVKETYRVERYSTTGTTPSVSVHDVYDGSHVGLFISYEN